MSVLLATLAVWTLLAAAPLGAARLGSDGAALAAQSAAAALLLATTPRGVARRAASAGAACAALAAGCASFPAWVAAALALGLALGLTPVPAIPPQTATAPWACSLVAAPLFEELLYRERLFDALRARWGPLAAIGASSALFAAPHLEAWHVVGTFLVGIGLGALRALGTSLACCIGLHAGLNLAALACGSPPLRHALGPTAAAVVGAIAVAIALALERRARARGRSAGGANAVRGAAHA